MALSILVVSKAVAFRRTLTSTLENRGHAVTFITSVAEAQVWSQRVDVAVLDLELLGSDGEQLVSQLKKRRTAQHFVFVTGGRPPAGSIAWAAGHGPVLHKSRLHELLHIIRVQRRSRQIEMPTSVTDALRVNQPIGPWPQKHDLTSLP